MKFVGVSRFFKALSGSERLFWLCFGRICALLCAVVFVVAPGARCFQASLN